MHRVVGTAVALIVAAALAGCAVTPAPGAGAVGALGSSTPTPTPTATPTPTVFLGTGRSLEYSCDELVDPAVIRSLNANLQENTAYRPAETSIAERAVAIRGTACEWMDPKTGVSLIVTAAHPDPPTLGSISATTRSYAKTTTSFGYDVSGYVVGQQAEIFTRTGYWATASSPLFSNLEVARIVMNAVQDSLPVG